MISLLIPIFLIIGFPLACLLLHIYKDATDKKSGLYLHKIHTPIQASYKLSSRSYGMNDLVCRSYIMNHIKPHDTKLHTIVLIPKHDEIWVDIPYIVNEVLYFDDSLSSDDKYLFYKFLYSGVNVETRIPFYSKEQITFKTDIHYGNPNIINAIVIHTDNPSLYTAACFTTETDKFYVKIL